MGRSMPPERCQRMPLHLGRFITAFDLRHHDPFIPLINVFIWRILKVIVKWLRIFPAWTTSLERTSVTRFFSMLIPLMCCQWATALYNCVRKLGRILTLKVAWASLIFQKRLDPTLLVARQQWFGVFGSWQPISTTTKGKSFVYDVWMKRGNINQNQFWTDIFCGSPKLCQCRGEMFICWTSCGLMCRCLYCAECG